MQQGELLDKIKQKGYRLTQQRQIILDEIVNCRDHPAADEIFRRVKMRLARISFGTVYRNLKVLKDLGLIVELSFRRGFSRYDGNTASHQHFICLGCARIIDIDQPVKVEIDEAKLSEMELEISDYRLDFYGRCPDCNLVP